MLTVISYLSRIFWLAKSSCLITYHNTQHSFTLNTHSALQWPLKAFDNEWFISLISLCLWSLSVSLHIWGFALFDLLLSFLFFLCYALRWLYHFVTDMMTFYGGYRLEIMKLDLFLSFAKCHINCPFTVYFSSLMVFLKPPFLIRDIFFFPCFRLDWDPFL